MIEAVDIRKTYHGASGVFVQQRIKALRGVSVTLPDASAIALIGESGCGKTTLGRIIAGLETFDSGHLTVDSVNVSSLPQRKRREHFRKVQIIHQDPYASLNPARPIAQALLDPLTVQARNTGRNRQWVQSRAHEVLSLVGLNPAETMFKYPHQLSGGQRQRVVIARALTVDPLALVADEAVSMIDVSLRLGVLNLLEKLRKEFGIAVIFITHDVAAARYVAKEGKIVVIYKGEVVESGPTDELIERPAHPYTQALLSAVPVLRGLEDPGPDRFIAEPEDQSVQAPDTGCLFAPRCPLATDQCRSEHPELQSRGETRQVACFYPEERRVVAIPLTIGQGS